MEAVSQQITEDNQSNGSLEEFSVNRLQRELNMLGYSGNSNAVSVKQFLNSITEGLYYVCTCCNRMLYRKTERKFQCSAYPRDIFTEIMSFDNVEYICGTCHLKAKKGQIPCQAVCEKLDIDEMPSELEALRKLESVLVAQRLVFQKIVVMPKGQQKKIRGAICNDPVNCDTVCQSLPRPSELSGIILLKSKRKLEYSGHQYCEAVRPEFVKNALQVLKRNNKFYENVEIGMHNVGEDLMGRVDCSDMDDDIGHNSSGYNDCKTYCMSADKSSLVTDSHNSDSGDGENEDEADDPQNKYRASVNETCLESFVPDYPVICTLTENNGNESGDELNNLPASAGNEVFSIAPGEEKHPIHFMQDKHCEELAFPVLFPKGQSGYQVEREVRLSPTKYFNARLLNYTGGLQQTQNICFLPSTLLNKKK